MLDLRHYALALGGAIAILGAPAASAQEATPADPSEQAIATGDGEIIVTAQRRSERLRDVPISMTVANAEALELAGVTNMMDLALITPGLNIDRFATATQPTIRGVTTRENSPGNDANVSIYVDGVYQASQQANGFDLPDIERIEVSKGPQGTLYGRNATGGAIQIFTARPEYDFGGSVTASYASFNESTVRGYVNVPLVDNVLALNIAAYQQHTDGYYNDLLNGGDFGEVNSTLLRAKLLYEPTSWLNFLLAAQYSDREDETVGAGSPLNGNSVGSLTPGTIVPTRPYDVAVNDPFFNVESRQISLASSADLGFATLGAITAHQDVDIHFLAEGDFTSLNASAYRNSQPAETFSQEVTLTSNGDSRIDWVTGVFYYENTGAYDPLGVESGGAPILTRFGSQDTEAYAIFGEVNFELTERLSLIAGVRYSHEVHTLSGHTGAATPNLELAEASFQATTPRLSLIYELTPDTNVYFTYSEGFKSGGFNTSGLSGLVPFDQELVDAFEIGLKSQPSDSLRYNIAAFHYDYTDQQVLSFIVLPGGATAQRTLNAAASEIYGLEADLNWEISEDWTLNAGLSLLHAEFTDYPVAAVQLPILTGGVPCNCGNAPGSVNATGNQLIRAPEQTLNLGLIYGRDFAPGRFQASAMYYYTSDYVFTTDERIGQPAYGTLGARASFAPAGTSWRLSVFGQNLTDEEIIVATSIIPQGDGVWYGAPRTFGVQVDYNF